MTKDLITRLNEGPVLCAEGYLFAMERRGYLQAGAFVPEVVLERPEVVTQLHREFIRAGSDVVQAFTYYGHREKLRIIGKENLLEPLQKNALKIAKDARDEFKDLNLLVAGNVANTNVYDPNDKKSNIECQKMFEEQVGWAKDAGVDFIIAEIPRFALCPTSSTLLIFDLFIFSIRDTFLFNGINLSNYYTDPNKVR